MVSKFEITLESAGIAIFDPFVLDNFLQERKINNTNLFDFFLENPQIGDEMIQQGIILPIYSIPPLDYQIIVNDQLESVIEKEWHKFTTTPFPLSVNSNKIVVADIYAIMDWEPNFYKELAVGNQEGGGAQSAATVDAGLYAVTINGFCESNYSGSSPKNKGYELLLRKVVSLPKIDASVDIDDFNFVVFGEI